MSPIDMNHEPLRLPAWVTALLVTFLPVLIAVLQEQDWKTALAYALGGLLVGTPIVAYAESKRAFTNSPATQASIEDDAWEQFEAMHGESIENEHDPHLPNDA